MKTSDKILWALLLIDIGMLIGFLTAIPIVRSDQNNQAVKDGRAEYYLDSNNNRQFRYKTK